MPLKRSSKKMQPETPVEEHFLAAPSLQDEHRQRVNEQITRLQERQMALVQETAHELEELKQHLTDDKQLEEQVARARQPLLNEIATLRTTLNTLAAEKERVEQELTHTQHLHENDYVHLQSALNGLKGAIRGQLRSFDQQVRTFTQDATENIESLLAAVEEETPAVVAEVQVPTPVPAVAHTVAVPAAVSLEELLAEFPTPEASAPVAAVVAVEEPRKIKKEKVKRERQPRSFRGLRLFAVRGLAFALVCAAGWGGLGYIQRKNLAAANGQVAGVSTTAPSAANSDDPSVEYKEAYAIVPFDQTTWETDTDNDIGFSIRYPNNATDLVKTPGGSNVWFPRFDGFLIRISAEDTTLDLDTWWNNNKGFYSDGNTITKGTFKSRPAWIVKSIDTTKTSGTTYIFATKTGVMEFWVKDPDSPPSSPSDDDQRVAKMVDSFTPLN